MKRAKFFPISAAQATTAEDLVRHARLADVVEDLGRFDPVPGTVPAIPDTIIFADHKGLQMVLDLAPLLSGKLDDRNLTGLTITRFVPLQLRRRGVELRIVMEGEATSPSRVDPALVKAIARGHRWFSELVSGRASNTLEIAKREALPDSYVRRLIPLASLAPSIIQAICDGSQPPISPPNE